MADTYIDRDLNRWVPGVVLARSYLGRELIHENIANRFCEHCGEWKSGEALDICGDPDLRCKAA